MMEWTLCNELMPPDLISVIAYVPNYGGGGNGRRIRAHFIPKLTVETDENYDGGDYCEKTDTYYVEEGWYEQNCYEDINWLVNDKVTHWMHLPPPPVSVPETSAVTNEQPVIEGNDEHRTDA